MTTLSTHEEFNLIAPVAIYLIADSRFEKQGVSAYRKLLKLAHPVTEGVSLAEIRKGEVPSDIYDRYNNLFEDVVLTEHPAWKTFFDKWVRAVSRMEMVKLFFRAMIAVCIRTTWMRQHWYRESANDVFRSNNYF